MTGRHLLMTALLCACAALLADATAQDTGLSPVLSGGELATGTLGDASCCCDSGRSGWFASVDYRLVRTHFSEAVAFATLNIGAGPLGPDLQVAGSELDFNYQSSFYFNAGYHLNDFADVRFSYWYLDDSTDVSGAPAANQVIVDPFGNLAPPGTEIDTTASVRLHVFDLEYLRRMEDPTWPTSVTYSAGLRMANVNQFYESDISAAGGTLSNGVFRVNWYGVGPYGSVTGRVWTCNRRLSGFAKAGAALLVGKNNITTEVSSTGAITGQPFTGGQSAGRVLVVPVLESELGASWQPSDCWRLSFGWLVQAWFDLGVSGGTFSGAALPALGLPPLQNVFGGADDANIMAFDGFFLRAEYNF